MTGHENDRNVDARLGEFGLELETAHSRQSDVEHQATCCRGELALQQFRRRTEHLHLQADRPEQAAERLAHHRIVVDDIDDRLVRTRKIRW